MTSVSSRLSALRLWATHVDFARLTLCASSSELTFLGLS